MASSAAMVLPDPARDEKMIVHKMNNTQNKFFLKHPKRLGKQLTRGCTQQHILIRVVEGVEDLRLDRIEMREFVQPLECRVVQGSDRQGRQVQEVRVWRVSLREDQVLKANCAIRLTSNPSVRQCPDVILCGQRVENRDGEHHILSFVVFDLEKKKTCHNFHSLYPFILY